VRRSNAEMLRVVMEELHTDSIVTTPTYQVIAASGKEVGAGLGSIIKDYSLIG
jgi:hypothetical protein